jgi:small conductance mechanosensitive channel
MAEPGPYVLGVPVTSVLYYIFAVLAVFAVGNISYAVVRRFLDPRVSRSNAKLAANVTRYAILFAGVYISTAAILGFNLEALGASLGIITIIVAFSSQQIIQNFLAGLLILINRPIRIEDWISFGSLPTGDVARVVDITLTSTMLEEMDGTMVIMPNSMILSSKIVNYTRSGYIEIPVKLDVNAGADVEKIRSIVRDIAAQHPWMRPSGQLEEHSALMHIMRVFPLGERLYEEEMPDALQPRVLIAGYAGGTLTLDIRIWIVEIQIRDDARSRFLELLLARLADEGIPI